MLGAWLSIRCFENTENKSVPVPSDRSHGPICCSTSQPTHKLQGAESFVRSRQSLGYWRISQYFMELEGSLLYSQELVTRSYLVHTTPTYFSRIQFNIILPPRSKYFYFSLLLWLSHQNPTNIYLLHVCYIPCPSHPPWFDYSSYIWRRVQSMY
jgi:hypothetical protein